MHTISELSELLGWSPYQVRTRIKELGEQFEAYLSRGRHNKLLVNSDGLSILRRLKQLEEEGRTIVEALELLFDEMEFEDQTGAQTETETQIQTPYELPQTTSNRNGALIRILEEQIQQLQDEVRFLREQNEDLRNMLNRQFSDQVPPWWHQLLGQILKQQSSGQGASRWRRLLGKRERS
ncbi:MAG: hypothetical protein ACE5JP_16820 [Candidatus Bipolaricaulia bacterium]